MFELSDLYIETLNGAKIVKDPETGILGIECGDCGLTSYNSNDIVEGFCGNCNAFHNPDKIRLGEGVEYKDVEGIVNNTADYLIGDLE